MMMMYLCFVCFDQKKTRIPHSSHANPSGKKNYDDIPDDEIFGRLNNCY